jgi:hypothetical protein
MLKRTRKPRSHDVLRRQQRQKSENHDTTPCQRTKGSSEQTRAHPQTGNEIDGFSKRAAKGGRRSCPRSEDTPPAFPFTSG